MSLVEKQNKHEYHISAVINHINLSEMLLTQLWKFSCVSHTDWLTTCVSYNTPDWARGVKDNVGSIFEIDEGWTKPLDWDYQEESLNSARNFILNMLKIT